ncbi:hypothetical protein MRO97_02240, partial [Dickeya dianthicola]
ILRSYLDLDAFHFFILYFTLLSDIDESTLSNGMVHFASLFSEATIPVYFMLQVRWLPSLTRLPRYKACMSFALEGPALCVVQNVSVLPRSSNHSGYNP